MDILSPRLFVWENQLIENFRKQDFFLTDLIFALASCLDVLDRNTKTHFLSSFILLFIYLSSSQIYQIKKTEPNGFIEKPKEMYERSLH